MNGCSETCLRTQRSRVATTRFLLAALLAGATITGCHATHEPNASADRAESRRSLSHCRQLVSAALELSASNAEREANERIARLVLRISTFHHHVEDAFNTVRDAVVVENCESENNVAALRRELESINHLANYPDAASRAAQSLFQSMDSACAEAGKRCESSRGSVACAASTTAERQQQLTENYNRWSEYVRDFAHELNAQPSRIFIR